MLVNTRGLVAGHYNATNQGGSGGSGIVVVKYLSSLGASGGSNSSGLVLHYDMKNNHKSFKGRPTTNLLYATDVYLATPFIWVNAGAHTSNSNETDVDPPTEANASGLRIISGTCTTTGSIHFGCAQYSCLASTTYSMSVWFRQNRAGATEPYMRTVVSNIQIGAFSYNGVEGSGNWPANTWIRITATGTTAVGETGIFLSNYISNAGDKVWYYGSQVEQQPFATPLVLGTRSNTQSLLDLSGCNTLTTTSLAYASDNTFSFNGSNTYIDVSSNNLITGLNPFSIETFYNNLGGAGAIFGNYGTTTANTIWVFSGGIYINDSSGYIPNYGTLTYGTGPHCVTITRNSSGVMNVYLDGVNKISNVTNSASIVAAQNWRIGADAGHGLEPFNGTIYSVKVFNRVLSASEVKRSFDSQRSRFGL